jgi:CxxC motif-containing protein
MKVICIMCPRGCELEVTKGRKITVTGAGCPRGIIYGEREVTKPERMITTIKKYEDKTISLKSSKPVPKEKVYDVLKEIKSARLPKNIENGKTLIKNVCDTDADIVITNVNKKV